MRIPEKTKPDFPMIGSRPSRRFNDLIEESFRDLLKKYWEKP
jgi:hypothetical protein